MAMNRRNFLTRSGLALGALIVGDVALEELERLTHVRKSFPSAGILGPTLEGWRFVRLASTIEVSGEALLAYEASRDGRHFMPLSTLPLSRDRQGVFRLTPGVAGLPDLHGTYATARNLLSVNTTEQVAPGIDMHTGRIIVRL